MKVSMNLNRWKWGKWGDRVRRNKARVGGRTRRNKEVRRFLDHYTKDDN